APPPMAHTAARFDSPAGERTTGGPGPGPSWTGVICYWSTGYIVVLGLFFGTEYVNRSTRRGYSFHYAGEAYANWDGQWYKKIASDGYDYRLDAPSSVAFFPAYPLLGGGLARIAGIRPELALLVVSNSFLIVLFWLTVRYVEG